MTFKIVGISLKGEYEKLKLSKNPDEVEEVFTVPLKVLADPEIAKRQFFRVGKEPSPYDYEMPVFCTQPRVWGFTAIQTNFILIHILRLD